MIPFYLDQKSFAVYWTQKTLDLTPNWGRKFNTFERIHSIKHFALFVEILLCLNFHLYFNEVHPTLSDGQRFNVNCH